MRQLSNGRSTDMMREEPQSWRSKAGIATAFASLVNLTTYDVPVDMVNKWLYVIEPTYEYVFKGRGIILESEVVDDSTYKSIIIAPANLFERSNDTPPHQVQFDVCSSDGKLSHIKGELVACDFHYNLAAISIQTSFPLQPATLRHLTDVWSIDVAAYDNHSRFGRHSDLFKVQPGTKIIALYPSIYPPFSVHPACCVFRASHIAQHSCKELYWVRCPGIAENHSGGALINHSGQLLGILFQNSAFLPSNFVSRWWSHYKSKEKFCRPWVGVEITNLAEARLRFLEHFKNLFSDTGTGVIVTKSFNAILDAIFIGSSKNSLFMILNTRVEKDTPAYCSGIRLKDVIVKCDGKWVQSKIQFFESMWDNAGKSVELTVLRASDSQRLNLSMSIGETTPTNFYRWNLPHVSKVILSDTSSNEQSDASSAELSDASSDELSDAMVLDTVNAQTLSSDELS